MKHILAVLGFLVVIAFYDGSVTVPMNTSELAILTDTMLIAGFSEEEIPARTVASDVAPRGSKNRRIRHRKIASMLMPVLPFVSNKQRQSQARECRPLGISDDCGRPNERL